MPNVTFTQETSIHHKVFVGGEFAGIIVDTTVVTEGDSIAYGVKGVDWCNDRIRFVSKNKKFRGRTIKNKTLSEAKNQLTASFQ